MNAHTDSHCWFLVLQQVLVQLFQPSFDFHCSFDRGLCFCLAVLLEGNPKYSKHSIAGEFVHHAAALGHSWNADFHTAVEPVHQCARIHPFRHTCEVHRIREQHGDGQLATLESPVA